MVKWRFDGEFLFVVAGFPAELGDPSIPNVKGGPYPRQQTSAIATTGGEKPATTYF